MIALQIYFVGFLACLMLMEWVLTTKQAEKKLYGMTFENKQVAVVVVSLIWPAVFAEIAVKVIANQSYIIYLSFKVLRLKASNWWLDIRIARANRKLYKGLQRMEEIEKKYGKVPAILKEDE